MAANPPVCTTCGSILMGYGWDEKLNFPVHYCLKCRAPGASKGEALKAAA